MNLKAMAGRRILFLALADWAGASRLLGEFGRLGCECAVISPPDFTVTMTRFATVLFPLPSPRSQGLPKLRLMTSRFRLEAASGTPI